MDNQENTLFLANKSGLQPLVDKISQTQQLISFDSMSNIPVPPESLPKLNLEISIAPEVESQLKDLKEIMGNPDMSVEFPFCIFGKQNGQTINLTQLKFLYTDFKKLSQTSVSFDPKLTGTALSQAIDNPDCDVFVLGHTHPNVPESLKTNLLTSKIEEADKTQFGIREIGLNLSLQDLHQLSVVREQVKPETKVMSSILMFNGDMVFVDISENGFCQETKTI